MDLVICVIIVSLRIEFSILVLADGAVAVTCPTEVCAGVMGKSRPKMVKAGSAGLSQLGTCTDICARWPGFAVLLAGPLVIHATRNLTTPNSAS